MAYKLGSWARPRSSDSGSLPGWCRLCSAQGRVRLKHSLSSTCPAVHWQDHLSLEGHFFFKSSCIKMPLRLVVALSNAYSPPSLSPPGPLNWWKGRVSGREKIQRGPRKMSSEVNSSPHLGMETAVLTGGFGGRCQWGGERGFGCRQRHRLSAMRELFSCPPLARAWHHRYPVGGAISLYPRAPGSASPLPSHCLFAIRLHWVIAAKPLCWI